MGPNGLFALWVGRGKNGIWKSLTLKRWEA
jgi:hypothetical protein